MSIRFTSLLIPGIVEPFAVPSREVQVSRMHFFGVQGESEIRGESGGRTIQIPMLVYDDGNKFPSRDSLAVFFSTQVGKLIGKNGVLSILRDGFAQETYPECTLDAANIRAYPGIVLDVAGTLGGKYFCQADFTFRQL